MRYDREPAGSSASRTRERKSACSVRLVTRIAGILVEVQEGAGASREIAALALSQLGQPAKLRQQRLKLIKVFPRRMSHGLSMTLSSGATQGRACTGRLAVAAQRGSGCREISRS
jgi:hypothetical protein